MLTHSNPYPETFREITDFRYETGLVLLRLRDAAKTRKGEDADYILGAPYRVSFKVDGVPHMVEAPAGMLTDLASVPWIARWLVDRVGPHLEAAIIHDWLYVAWQQVAGRGARQGDRAFADRVFFEGMRAAHVARWARTAIWGAVMLFGWRAYRDTDPTLVIDLDAPEILAQFPDTPLARMT